MKDGKPFGIGWRLGELESAEHGRVDSHIRGHHDGRQRDGGRDTRPHAAYSCVAGLTRWLGDEPDPRDLMKPYPSEPMRMWPISTRVNKTENDDPSIIEPIELATSAA
jgi:hypothetical protein